MKEPDIRDKMLEWLGKWPTERVGHGEKSEVAKQVKLSTSYHGRLVNKRRTGNLTLRTIQQLANAKGCKVWQLFWMVEHGVHELPPPPQDVPKAVHP